jgi:hypothetical protein
MRTNLMWPRSHAFVLVICCCQFLALGQSTMTLSQLTSPAEQQPSPNAVPNDNELTTQPPASQPGQPRPVRSKTPPTPRERAWQLLESACASDKTTDRATATLVLGLIPNNVKSARLAEKALTDDKAEVRSAAAAALGEMKSRASIPKLRAAFDDQDPLVVLAAAHSLDLMHDSSAYEVYYEVLNGERKASKGLISSQASLFHDPKRVAALGFEEGIGFIPHTPSSIFTSSVWVDGIHAGKSHPPGLSLNSGGSWHRKDSLSRLRGIDGNRPWTVDLVDL